MASEDDYISALLSEPTIPEAPVEVSDDLSPVLLESIRSHEKEVVLSPEEAAWVDSCLVLNSELSNDDWEAMKLALLDALSKENSIHVTHIANDSVRQEQGEGIRVSEEAKPASLHAEQPSVPDIQMEQTDNTDEGKDSTEASEEKRPELIGAEEHCMFRDRDAPRDEDDTESASSDGVHDDMESQESIFKVWELEISFSDEDDGLTKELNKLLKSSSLETSPLPPYDPGVAGSQAKIDELVADMSDLSLQQFDN